MIKVNLTCNGFHVNGCGRTMRYAQFSSGKQKVVNFLNGLTAYFVSESVFPIWEEVDRAVAGVHRDLHVAIKEWDYLYYCQTSLPTSLI